MAVGTVVDQVPQDVGLLGDLGAGQHQRRVGRQVQRAAGRPRRWRSGAGDGPRGRRRWRRSCSPAGRGWRTSPGTGSRTRSRSSRASSRPARRARTWGCRTASRSSSAIQSGHGTRTISASKQVSRDPFCLYMGKKTRCSIPSRRSCSGRKCSSADVKSGRRVSVPRPRPQVGDRGRRCTRLWCGKRGRQGRQRVADRLDVGAGVLARAGASHRASGAAPAHWSHRAGVIHSASSGRSGAAELRADARSRGRPRSTGSATGRGDRARRCSRRRTGRSRPARPRGRPRARSATSRGAPGTEAVGVGAGQHGRPVLRGDRGRPVEAGRSHAGEQISRRSPARRTAARPGPRSGRPGDARSPGRCGSPTSPRTARAARSGCCRTWPARSRRARSVLRRRARSASMASSSSAVSRGDPIPVVRSHAGSEG